MKMTHFLRQPKLPGARLAAAHILCMLACPAWWLAIPTAQALDESPEASPEIAIADLVGQNLELRRKVEQLQAALAEALTPDQAQRRQAAIITGLLRENRELERRFEIARTRLDRQESELHNLRLQGGVEEIRQQLRREQQLLISVRRELETTVDEIRAEVDNLSRRLQTATIERELAKQQAAQAERELALLRQQHRDLQRSRSSRDRRRDEPETGESEAAAERDRQVVELRRAAAGIYEQNRELYRRLEQAQLAAQENRQTVADLEREFARKREMVETLNRDNSRMARRMQEQTALLRRLEETIVRLEMEKAELFALEPPEAGQVSRLQAEQLEQIVPSHLFATPLPLLASDEEYQSTLRRMATAALQRDDLETAIRHLRQALRLDPRDPDTLLALGRIYRRQGELELAIETFSRLAEERPQDGNVQCQLGLLKTAAGEAAPAEQHFRKALEIDPQDHESAYNLAMLLAADRTRFEEAREWYRRARQTGAAADVELDRMFQFTP